MLPSITSSLHRGTRLVLITLSILSSLPVSAAADAAQTMAITVTTTMPGVVADGQCSLVEAIANANADAIMAADCPAGNGADMIMLQAGATYTLTAIDNTTDGANGLPSITSDVTIMGNGAIVQRSSADGTPEFRIFHVGMNGALRLRDVTVENGIARGSDTSGSYSRAYPGLGGGIYNRGVVTAENSVVRDNMAVGGSGVDQSGQAIAAGGHSFGGGIYSIGTTIALTNTLVNNNLANGGKGTTGGYSNGGGIFNGPSVLILTDSVVRNNASQGGDSYTANNNGGIGLGGGILAEDNALSRILNSTVSNNRAIGGNNGASSELRGPGLGGGMYILNEDNQFPNTGLFEIRNSTVISNVASSGIGDSAPTNLQGGVGGGIVLDKSRVNIVASQIHRNHAEGKGGGIALYYGSTAYVTSSTISQNTAQRGGGMFAQDGTLYLTNSTISGNTAVRGGGIMNGPDQATSAAAFMWNSTISYNQATDSGGGLVNDSAVARTRLWNSIVANNVAGDCSQQDGVVATGGYNLDSDGSCGFGAGVGDMPRTDPQLGPLQDNGGPTWTHALLPGSPAIDHGNPNGCRLDYNNQLITEDQRGVARPRGAACDIGAYEAEQSPVTPTATPSATPSATPTMPPTSTTSRPQRVLLPLVLK